MWPHASHVLACDGAVFFNPRFRTLQHVGVAGVAPAPSPVDFELLETEESTEPAPSPVRMPRQEVDRIPGKPQGPTR